MRRANIFHSGGAALAAAAGGGAVAEGGADANDGAAEGGAAAATKTTWTGVLVRTGVFKEGDETNGAAAVVDGVAEARAPPRRARHDPPADATPGAMRHVIRRGVGQTRPK